MSLLNLQTDLKSLKFGVGPSYDRPGLGNSGQPYITTPIPSDTPPSQGTVLDQINDFLSPIPNSPDFLLRGGINAARDTATDVLRLGKFFTNLKSSAGVSFVAKQNSLSQIAVRTQASGEVQNEGVYTPLSTLAQAGINFVGGHVDKQGINGVTKYESLARNEITNLTGNPNSLGGSINITDEADNRLIQLAKVKIGKLYNVSTKRKKITQISNQDGIILEYNGGPNSTLGVGSTQIKLAKNNKGGFLTTVYDNSLTPNYLTWGSNNMMAIGLGFEADLYRDTKWIPNTWNNPYHNTIQDFREPLLKDKKTSTIMGIAPAYNDPDKRIDGPAGSRINYTSPGQRGNVINYSKGKIVNGKVSVVDRINFQPLYKSSEVTGDKDKKNDLVKFRIAAVLRDNKKVFMHFRAFINSFSDSYNASWDSIKYMGRGEDFYKYNGFGRKISLSFTVAAQSKPELMAQYKKLNFLASTLAPDYGKSGYMGGVMTTLTVGAWCYELPGFINSLGLEVPTESPWEIAVPATEKDADTGNPISSDKTVKEMPHICNVSMEYTPIHTFRPELQDNDYYGSKGEVSKYGDQHYLGLTNKYNNNYVPVSLSDAETPNSKQST